MEAEHITSAARERILDTASELFYEHGIQTVGVDTVIARAGVAKMTLYRHFHSKDELVAAYLARRDARWREWLDEKVMTVDAPARERILMVFDVIEEWVATADFHGCAFVNANAEHAGTPSEPVIRQHDQAVCGMLGKLAREAELKEPDEIARELFLLMKGAMVVARVEGSTDASTQARRAAKKLVTG